MAPKTVGQNSEVRSNAAFSRTDLLTLLAVLAVLMVGVRHLVASPREASYQARCMDNVRRLMVAQQQYAADNSDYLPWPNLGNHAGYAGWAYATLAVSTQALPSGAIQGTPQSGLLWKYLLNVQTYQCPLDFAQTNEYFVTSSGFVSFKGRFELRENKATSYVMNSAICGNGSLDLGRTYKLSQFRPNAIAMWEQDGSPFYFSDGASRPNEGIGIRHGTGGHMGRFDGGVEFISYSQYYAMLSSTNLSESQRLRCNPGSLSGD